MWIDLAAFVLAYLLGEILGLWPFRKIRSRFGPPEVRVDPDDQPARDFRDNFVPRRPLAGNNATSLSVFKGRLERFVLLLGLAAGFPQILILFGALKIATRFKDDENPISNDYFLVGNLASVSIALATAALYMSDLIQTFLMKAF